MQCAECGADGTVMCSLCCSVILCSRVCTQAHQAHCRLAALPAGTAGVGAIHFGPEQRAEEGEESMTAHELFGYGDIPDPDIPGEAPHIEEAEDLEPARQYEARITDLLNETDKQRSTIARLEKALAVHDTNRKTSRDEIIARADAAEASLATILAQLNAAKTQLILLSTNQPPVSEVPSAPAATYAARDSSGVNLVKILRQELAERNAALVPHFRSLISLLTSASINIDSWSGLERGTALEVARGLMKGSATAVKVVDMLSLSTLSLYTAICQTLITYAITTPIHMLYAGQITKQVTLEVGPFKEALIGYGSYGVAVGGLLLGVQDAPLPVIIRASTTAKSLLFGALRNELIVREEVLGINRSFYLEVTRLSVWIYRYLANLAQAGIHVPTVKTFATTNVNSSDNLYAASVVVMQRTDLDLRQWVECVMTGKKIEFRPAKSLEDTALGKNSAPRARMPEQRPLDQRTKLIKFLCKQAINSLQHLHSLALIHGDPSFANMGASIDMQGGVQLFDMDFAAIRPGIWAPSEGAFGEQNKADHAASRRAVNLANRIFMSESQFRTDSETLEYIERGNFQRYYNLTLKNTTSRIGRVWKLQTLSANATATKLDEVREEFLLMFDEALTAIGVEFRRRKLALEPAQVKKPTRGLKASKSTTGLEVFPARSFEKVPYTEKTRNSETAPKMELPLVFVGMETTYKYTIIPVDMAQMDFLMFWLHMFEEITQKRELFVGDWKPWRYETREFIRPTGRQRKATPPEQKQFTQAPSRMQPGPQVATTEFVHPAVQVRLEPPSDEQPVAQKPAEAEPKQRTDPANKPTYGYKDWRNSVLYEITDFLASGLLASGKKTAG